MGIAAHAPNAIREQFYRLTNFGISRKIFDLGNVKLQNGLEKTHEFQTKIVEQILNDGKRIIILGGGGGISYPDGLAMANAFGQDRWLAINVDARLDVRTGGGRNGETAYRRLLDERLLVPKYFNEIAFQPYFVSPVHHAFLQKLGVNMVNLEQLRSRETADLELRELIRQEFINHSRSLSILFGFDMQAIRASDAPGVTEPSPFGLRAGEFLTLVQFAAKLVNTRIVEFTEFNPNLDPDNRTAKLVAIAMHKFCSSISEI